MSIAAVTYTGAQKYLNQVLLYPLGFWTLTGSQPDIDICCLQAPNHLMTVMQASHRCEACEAHCSHLPELI